MFMSTLFTWSCSRNTCLFTFAVNEKALPNNNHLEALGLLVSMVNQFLHRSHFLCTIPFASHNNLPHFGQRISYKVIIAEFLTGFNFIYIL